MQSYLTSFGISNPSHTNIVMLELMQGSLVPQGGPVCEECPLGLNAFLSTRPPKGLRNIRSDHLVIPNMSDGELHEIMIKSRGHFVHTGRGIEPTVMLVDTEQAFIGSFQALLAKSVLILSLRAHGIV